MDEIEEIDLLIKELRERKKKRKREIACSWCGAAGIYAKGLCRNCWGRQRRYGSPEYRRKDSLPQKVKEATPWRDRLAVAVLGTLENKPCDFDESVDYALSLIREREAEIIKERYEKRLTLQEIASEYGVTRERIRQILAKSQRKLRGERIKPYLVFGKSAVDARNAEKQKVATAGEKSVLVDVKGLPEELRNERIEELATVDMSVRTYNVLARSGLKTIGDVYDLLFAEGDGIRSLRNCGAKTEEEIYKIILKVCTLHGFNVL